MTFHPYKRDREIEIKPSSKVSLMVLCTAVMVTASTCALWYHMDADISSKVSLQQFQTFAVELQNDNPPIHVPIPGVRIDQDITAKRTTTQQNGL